MINSHNNLLWILPVFTLSCFVLRFLYLKNHYQHVFTKSRLKELYNGFLPFDENESITSVWFSILVLFLASTFTSLNMQFFVGPKGMDPGKSLSLEMYLFSFFFLLGSTLTRFMIDFGSNFFRDEIMRLLSRIDSLEDTSFTSYWNPSHETKRSIISFFLVGLFASFSICNELDPSYANAWYLAPVLFYGAGLTGIAMSKLLVVVAALHSISSLSPGSDRFFFNVKKISYGITTVCSIANVILAFFVLGALFRGAALHGWKEPNINLINNGLRVLTFIAFFVINVSFFIGQKSIHNLSEKRIQYHIEIAEKSELSFPEIQKSINQMPRWALSWKQAFSILTTGLSFVGTWSAPIIKIFCPFK